MNDNSNDSNPVSTTYLLINSKYYSICVTSPRRHATGALRAAALSAIGGWFSDRIAIGRQVFGGSSKLGAARWGNQSAFIGDKNLHNCVCTCVCVVEGISHCPFLLQEKNNGDLCTRCTIDAHIACYRDLILFLVSWVGKIHPSCQTAVQPARSGAHFCKFVL